ncbi:extensin precursor [Iris pallida]|uniref:Extensin n=1 Tax=Iris pallida TaxID=29817 RepID=A0AAX6GTS0_IRIPA|nr:extensin precursor [Iris pallida]KAJ6831944.1 extensin precursor [Iris pallida]
MTIEPTWTLQKMAPHQATPQARYLAIFTAYILVCFVTSCRCSS